jgi:ADP-ribosylglycohydrolase
MFDNIMGTLFGLAIGDAMGMPSELWSWKRIRRHFGRIEDFLDGPEENEIARHFKRGQYTDDTTQALLILDALAENGFRVNREQITNFLVTWAERTGAFDKPFFGASSTAVLLAAREGKDTAALAAKAETNGAAMRIAPIGCLFPVSDLEGLVHYVVDLTKTTHATDVALAGAAMIATAVASAVEGREWQDIVNDALAAATVAATSGVETMAASPVERASLGVELAEQYRGDDERFAEKVYGLIGAGLSCSESVPAALAIAYYCRDPERSALMAANLGGDTDTIGAMATAICGARTGFLGLDPEWVETIRRANPETDWKAYTDLLMTYRGKTVPSTSSEKEQQ